RQDGLAQIHLGLPGRQRGLIFFVEELGVFERPTGLDCRDLLIVWSPLLSYGRDKAGRRDDRLIVSPPQLFEALRLRSLCWCNYYSFFRHRTSLSKWDFIGVFVFGFQASQSFSAPVVLLDSPLDPIAPASRREPVSKVKDGP